MTTAGWLFMAAAWAVIGAVTAYCYKLILTKPKETGPEKPGPFSM